MGGTRPPARWARRQVLPGAEPASLQGTSSDRIFAVAVRRRHARCAGRCRSPRWWRGGRVLAGEWTVLGVRRTDSADPDWFYDPLTGRRRPAGRLAFRIHHRDETETGNIKQVWEMSRHHHITVLATAWWLTQDERYAQAAAAQLRSWWSANPLLSGVHWTSGIEAGIG